MDLSSQTAGGGVVDVNKLLASLGGGSGGGNRAGVWFEVGDSGSEPFVSFRRYSDNEIEFKEYDDLGMVKNSGVVVFTRDAGRVVFTLRIPGEIEEVVEGWMSIAVKDHQAEVYTAWRLVDEEHHRRRFLYVLTGYLHLQQAEFEMGESGTSFENKGVGLSGEEEGRAGFVVVKPGKL